MVVEEYVKIRNLSIYTKRMGSGIPLVFLHGGPGGEHRYFLPHLEYLKDHFELIFYDQRGCGKSEVDSDNHYTFEEEVETLEELRKHFGMEKLNLVGESWGSMLALLYASKYDNHVNKLFLTAAVGATNEGYLQFGELLENRLSPDDQQSLNLVMKDYKEGKVKVEEIFKIIDPYYLYSAENLDKKTKTKSNAEVNQILGKEIVEHYNKSLDFAKLREIPILIAQGEADIITPSLLESLFLHYLPHAQLRVIENCGHWSVIEQPLQLGELIQNYLKN